LARRASFVRDAIAEGEVAMARRSVLTLVLAGIVASACVSVQTLTAPTPLTIPDFSFTPPTIPPVVIPTLPTLPPLPTVPPLPTLPPEPVDTPEPIATSAPNPPSEPTPQPVDTTLPVDTTGPADSGGPAFTPPASPIDISSLLTAPVGLVNLSDSNVTVSLDIFDSGSDQGTIAKREIDPYGSLFENVLEATYLATFTQAGTPDKTCTFDAKAGAEVDFTVLNGAVLVSKPAVDPASGADLFIDTSPLCQSHGS
jgi:hypothetical protein